MRFVHLVGLGVAIVGGCGIRGPGADEEDDGRGPTSSGVGAGLPAGPGSGPGAGPGPSTGAGPGVGGGTSGVPELGGTLTLVGTAADGLNRPRDLAFHPQRPGEVWVVNQAIDGTVIFFDAGGEAQTSELRIDYYAAHFMDGVSSIAMGAADTFATCQESRNTWNGQQAPDDFMGPTLWPADLSIYGKANQSQGGLLGSHLDMLHESPWCMGIAHDHANVYWVFDGRHGDVVRYDFQAPHIVGGDDHSDGIIRRYDDVSVTRVADVPSHLELDAATGWLYVADTGSGRVLRLDTASGQNAGSLSPTGEWVAEYSRVQGATVEVFASGLGEPSGLALHDGRLFVGDHQSGTIVVFDLAGAELARLETGASELMGLTVGPQGRLWYVDGGADQLVRVDP
ncbi:MAG: hypothetical protein R3B72_03665 [Polyangiaceae bacterium]